MTSNNSLKILLVEDSASDAALLQENILSSGAKDISISVVQSLNEAKEYLKNNHPDAVLLDLTLPDSSGLDTVREVRSISPDLPIVVLTGVDDENTGVEAMRAGVQDYLVKGQTDGRTIIRVIRYSIERKRAEKLLIESKKDLDRAQAVAYSGSWRLDIRNNKLTWSDESYRIFDVPTGTELTYESFLSYIHPDDKEYVDTKWKAALAGEKYDIEHRIIVDGQIKWVRERAELEFKKDGTFLGGFGTVTDITERKRAEGELRKLASVVQHTSEFISLASLDGKIIFCNEAGADMLGLPHEDTRQMSILDVISENYKETVKNEVLPTLKKTGHWKGELQYLNLKTSKLTDVYATTFIINDPNTGKPLYLANTSIDISERKRIEDALKFLVECGCPASGEDFFQSLARYLGQTMGMDFVCIDQLEENLLAAKTVAVYFDGKFEDNISYTLKDTPCGDVVGKSICSFTKDVRHLFPNDKVLQDMKAESYVGTTLWSSQGKPIGLIAIIGRKPLADTKLATSILQLAAVRAAGELERRQAEDAIKRAATRFEILSGTAAKLLESKRPQQIVNSLCSRVMEYLDCHIFVNYLVDEQTHRLHLNTTGGLPEKMVRDIEWLDFGQAICGRVAQEGKRIVAENIQESCDARADLVRSVGIRAYACHPIMTQGKVIGTLSFGTKSRKTFSDDDLVTMKTVTDHVATAMERVLAEETLRKAHDELDARVKERTAELGEMVLELQKQIVQRVRAEEASRSASLYARGLLEASPDPLVTISPEGKITDINRATELVTGVQRQNLVGSDFSDYFTEPKKAKEVYKRVLAEGMVKDYPLIIRHVSGHTTDVLYNATLYKNEAGQVQGIFAAARDVTEHNRIEKLSRITNVLLGLFAQKSTRKEYLDSVVNAIRDWSGCQCVGIRLTNSDGLIPYESQIGFNREFLVSESVLSLKTDTCACMRVVMQTPEPQDAPVTTLKGSFRCDNTFEFFNSLPEQKKARYRGNCMRNGFASLAVVPIRYRDKVLGAIHLADRKGNKTPAQTVEFIENMAMLIGEAVHRFDIETELRQSEERYRQLVELSPEGIGVERDDKIVFINTAATGLLGAKNSAQLVGKSILDFVHPDYRKRTHRQLEFLRRKQKALPLRENIFLRVDRTPIDVEVAATPLIYENKPAAQIVFRDITERKLAQERIITDQKHLRLLTAELLLTEERERHEIAMALHDSLGPILAFSKRELGTLQKSAPAQIAEALKNVSDNISEAVKQTRTLTFDLSPPTLYTLGFEIAIEELIERFCEEHKLGYSFQNSDAPKPLTDPVKVLLYRSIREMLINIAKHASAKFVKVMLSRVNNDIEIAIEDDGKGFDVSVPKEKSKGLGLFSVRERLRHIGGKLEIESKRGKGTHIILTAPLKIE
ncbi:MAG: PAS domain S-box protein [Sedimentisphaerales bacterium]|jgi:PAS domain S-box-containing protein